MHALVTSKCKKDLKQNNRENVETPFSPIITLLELYVAMETRVLIGSGPILNAIFSHTPMMLQIKFNCDWPTGLRDIHV